MHPAPTPRDRARTDARRIALIVGLLVWASCAWFGSWQGNPNNSVRLFAAISLVEDGDTTIDEFAPLTMDKAEFDGHAYMDKAPGMTIMAMPAVLAADVLTGERSAALSKAPGSPDLDRFLRLRLRLAAASGPALLTGIAAALLFDLALMLTGSASGALMAAIAYALGTPIWGWSATVLGHAPVAAMYVVALWALTRGPGRPTYALAGAALGWAVVVEHQAVLAGGVLATLGIVRAWPATDRWRLLAAGAAAGLCALLPLIGYNLVAFGTPFRLGYQGVVGWAGMDQGLFGLTWPDPRVLATIVVGPQRGLLWVAPVMALAAFGLADLRPRRVAVACAATAAVVLLVNAAYVYWNGGNSTGPRHAMPAVGMLALGIAPLRAGLTTIVGRMAAATVLAASVAVNLMIAACSVFAPPTYVWPLQWVWERRLAAGDVTSVAGEWWGWPQWTGIPAWAVVAVPAMIWLGALARRCDACAATAHDVE